MYIDINNSFTFVLDCGKNQSSGQKIFCNSVAMCETTVVTFGKNLKLISFYHKKTPTNIEKRNCGDDIG